ncbi:hypothetical protein [Streptomyces sp. NPDC047000]|uniref:hypothetical protein n=1 Tax=Streptomyces sp. NPDC047000 TaxID=3155474 RepID=UPI0033DDC8E8
MTETTEQPQPPQQPPQPSAVADAAAEDTPQGPPAPGEETGTSGPAEDVPAVAGAWTASAPGPRKDRRVLRAALRWTAAVAVFAAFGAGTAYGVTGMDRTDVPGLATHSDGRWDYPTLVRPPLPSGSPGPLADSNKAGAHYADLRALVLPAPKGAEADPALRGTDGWLDRKVFLAEIAADQREDMAQQLTDYGLRHIAARGWTMPDGTRTRVFLLQFSTAAVAEQVTSGVLADYSSPKHPFRGAELYEPDDAFSTIPRPKDVTVMPYSETKPYGAEQLRTAFVSAGDTVAVVEQSRKGGAATVPFQQTVTLQSELLA